MLGDSAQISEPAMKMVAAQAKPRRARRLALSAAVPAALTSEATM